MKCTYTGLFTSLLISILVLHTQQQNLPVSCLYTQKVKLWDFNASFKTMTATGYDVPIIWRSNQPGIMRSGIALAGFQLYNTNITFSFDASLNNATNTGAIVNYNPHFNSQIQFAQFFVILVLSGCENKVELLAASHNMAVLNQSRTSAKTEIGTFVSSLFTFSNPNDFVVATELTCFKIGFTQNRLELQVYPSSSLGFPNSIDLTFQTDHKLDIIQKVNILIIIFSLNRFVPALSYQQPYRRVDVNINPSLIINSFDFYVNTNIFGSNYEEKCLIGISAIRIDKNQSMLLHYQQSTSNIYRSSSIQFSMYSGICFSQCPITYYIDYSNSSTQCIRCMNSISNCLNCNNGSYCTQCMPMYFLLQPDLCKTCHQAFYQCHKCNQTHCLLCFLGELISGGCSMLPGCSKVKQLMTFTQYHSSPCIACYQPEYSYSNGECICVGYIVTGICTIVKGCIEAIRINHVPICLGCHIELNFMLFNQTCVCIEGFSIVGEACLEICGDGRVFQSDCDDGNIFDGDGCSSNCVVERGFHCFNGSRISKSKCIYMKSDIVLIVQSIDKLDFVNEGKFIFKVAPEIGILSHMNFASLVHLDCNASFQITNVQYNSGYIEMNIPYQTDLESNTAKLTISLDPALFANQISIILVFEIRSQGAQLIIETNSKYNKQAAIVLRISSIMVLCLMILAPWFSKMISIELISTYQLIFLSHFLSKNYTESLLIFRELTISLLNIQYYWNKLSNVHLFFYNRLTYSFNNNRFSIYLLLGILILGFCLYKISIFMEKMKSRQKYFEIDDEDNIKKNPNFIECQLVDKNDAQKGQISLQKPKKKRGWRSINFKGIATQIYNIVLFNFSIGFFYLIILTTVTANIRFPSNIFSIDKISEIPPLIMLLIYLFSGLIFFKQWKTIVQSSMKEISQGRAKRRSINKYTSMFLTYLFFTMTALLLAYYQIISYGREAVLACALFFLVWLLFHPPYNILYNNLGIYLNLVTVSFFLLWIIVRDRVKVIRSGQIELTIIIIVTSLMVGCLALAILRILIRIYKGMNCNKQQKQSKFEEFEEQVIELQENQLPQQKYLQNKLIKMNQLSLKAMNYKQKMEALLIQNRRRELQNNYAIYSKQDAVRIEGVLPNLTKRGVLGNKQTTNMKDEAQVAAIKSKLRKMYRMGNFQKQIEKIQQ